MPKEQFDAGAYSEAPFRVSVETEEGSKGFRRAYGVSHYGTAAA